MNVYVVDQNAMRKDRNILPPTISNEPDAQFIVPDVALVEMVKTEEWEGTMRPSFALLAPEAHRTFFSLSVGEAIQNEIRNCKASDRVALLPQDLQKFFRSFLIELASGSDGDAMSKVHGGIGQTRLELLKHELNADAAKTRVEKMVEAWVKGLDPDIVKRLKNGTYDDAHRLALIKLNGDEFFLKIALDLGMTEPAAKVFRSGKPMLLRYLYLMALNALRWVIKDGLSSAKPKIVHNHIMDMQYVLIASFFDDLLTLDNEARKVYDDLSVLLAMGASPTS